MVELKLIHAVVKRPLWGNYWGMTPINTLRLKQNGCHFADNNFKCILFNEKISISIKISLKLVCKDPIDNIPALVQIMAWCRPGDKPLSEPVMVSYFTDTYVRHSASMSLHIEAWTI